MKALTIPTLQAQQQAQARQLAQKRAQRIATTAAQEVVMFEGDKQTDDDVYCFALCQLDDHMRECIEHLCFHKLAAAHETEDGYMLVQLLGDDDGDMMELLLGDDEEEPA